MIALRTWLLVFLAGLITVGCASGPPLTPVTNPNDRLHFEGLSILPPSGQNWFMDDHSITDQGWTVPVSFIKRLREKAESPDQAEMNFALVKTRNLGQMTSGSPDELLRYLAQDLENENKVTQDPGIKNFHMKASIEKYLERDCVSYEFSYEVHNWRPFPGYVFIMTAKGFLFLHPDSPTYVIGMEYYQRYLQGEKPYRVEPEVEPFLKSLVFTPLG